MHRTLGAQQVDLEGIWNTGRLELVGLIGAITTSTLKQVSTVLTVIQKLVDRCHAFAADLQSVITVAATRLRKPARHSVCESAIPVTPLPQLAALVAQVTELSKQFGDRVELHFVVHDDPTALEQIPISVRDQANMHGQNRVGQDGGPSWGAR